MTCSERAHQELASILHACRPMHMCTTELLRHMLRCNRCLRISTKSKKDGKAERALPDHDGKRRAKTRKSHPKKPPDADSCGGNSSPRQDGDNVVQRGGDRKLQARQIQHTKYMRNLVKRLTHVDSLREQQANGRRLSPVDEV